jgi:hypothetical protein
MLMRFLTSLKIPLIATLKDSQGYVQAAAQGIGICEISAYRLQDDLVQLETIAAWVNARRTVTMAQREAMIARAAYNYAQQRAFKGGDPVADWLQAEREVDSGLDDNDDSRSGTHGGTSQQT